MSIIWFNPVNRAHPLNRGLVSWWLNTPHARGGTTFRDLQGQNHGTLTNMDPATDWVTGGRRGSWGALAFETGTEYVSVGNIGITAEPFTVSAWVKPGSDTIGHCIWSLSNVGNGIDQFSIVHRGDSAGDFLAVATRSVTGAFLSATSTTAGVIGDWIHVTGVWRSTTNREIYINGRFEAVNTDAGENPGTNHVEIGRLGDGTPNWQWDGSIDDVRAWDRVLSDAEILGIYNLSRTGYGDLLNRRRMVFAVPAAGGGGGRIMGSLAGYGGLAGVGGLAGRHGGLAG